jgi:hypothetical protein
MAGKDSGSGSMAGADNGGCSIAGADNGGGGGCCGRSSEDPILFYACSKPRWAFSWAPLHEVLSRLKPTLGADSCVHSIDQFFHSIGSPRIQNREGSHRGGSAAGFRIFFLIFNY